MQANSTLPSDLRLLSNHLRHRAKAGLGMSAEECGRFAALIHLKAHDADKVVEQFTLMPELEDELHAVVISLDLARGPDQTAYQTAYQAALKAQQAELQRLLDGGGPVHVSRPGLAALSTPIGDTNVVSFPRAPRPADIDGGGDAA